MICQLCKQEKTLLKKSHIIPNFLYKNLYGVDRKLIHTEFDSLTSSFKKIKQTQTGFYEKNILCANCDNTIISEYERYASSALYERNLHSKTMPVKNLSIASDGLMFYHYKNLDYTKLKLFFLSIFWRAHIASDPFFEKVNLEASFETIRVMLLNQDAGKEDVFETAVIVFQEDETRPYKGLVKFRAVYGDGHAFFSFHMDNFMYHLK